MSCPWPSVTFNSHIPARPGVLLFVFARVWAESERIVWPRLEHFSRASVGQAMDRTASWRTTDAALVCFNLYRSASRTGGAKRSRVSPPEIGRRYHPSRRGIVPASAVPLADVPPETVASAPKRRHAAKKIHKKSAPVGKRSKRAKRG